MNYDDFWGVGADSWFGYQYMYLELVLWFLDVSLLGWVGSRLPGIISWFTGLGSMAAWWRILVALIRFLVPSTWFNGCSKGSGCLDSLPCCFPAWLGMFRVACFTFTCFHFLIRWTRINSWLVKVPGCLGSLHGSLNLVHWLPSKGSYFPGYGSCFPGLGSIVAWWRFLVTWIQSLVPWTWFHECLVKVLDCLVSLPGVLDLVSMIVRWRFLVAWIWFLVPWTWFYGCLVKVTHPWTCFYHCLVKVPDAWIHFLVPLTWFYDCLVKVPRWLDLVPGSPDLAPWLSAGGSLVPCSWNLVPGVSFWLPGIIFGCLELVFGSLKLVPWPCSLTMTCCDRSWGGRVVTVNEWWWFRGVGWGGGADSWLPVPGISSVVPWCFPAWLGWVLGCLE